MYLNENLIKFLESSAEISKTTIYVSDIKKLELKQYRKKLQKRLTN